VTLTMGALFAGYEGIGLGVRQVLDVELAWYSEIEPAACTVLEAHHPGVLNLGDITTVNWEGVAPVDVLTGGYQPMSTVQSCRPTERQER
jgi:DNA (cytosine-5)-methyltransferase 1